MTHVWLLIAMFMTSSGAVESTQTTAYEMKEDCLAKKFKNLDVGERYEAYCVEAFSNNPVFDKEQNEETNKETN